jgi:hypothetical protein
VEQETVVQMGLTEQTPLGETDHFGWSGGASEWQDTGQRIVTNDLPT